MSAQYLYPCADCDRHFNVDTSSAGREVTCPFCKTAIEIPKLSQLRQMQLERVADEFEDEPATQLGVAQTWLFVCGVPIILIGLITGAVLLWQAGNLETAIEKDQAILEREKAKIDPFVDQYPVEQTWAIWHDEILPNPPGVWEQSNLQYAAQAASVKRLIAYIALGFAGVGGALVGISFLFSASKGSSSDKGRGGSRE